MSRVVINGILLLGIGPLLVAADPPQRKPVSVLIEELGAKDYNVREVAAKAIEALGPEALPELRKAKDHPDMEVRRRIENAGWLPRFELAALVAPKRVTLDMRDEPLHCVIEELSRQTGYKLVVLVDKTDPRAQKPVTFRFDKATFWEAFDKTCENSRVVYYFLGSENTFFAYVATPFIHRHGPFRLVGDRLGYVIWGIQARTIELGTLGEHPVSQKAAKKLAPPSSGYLRFEFTINAEPRLKMLGIVDLSLSEAVDDQNQSLLPKVDAITEPSRHFRFSRRSLMSGHVPLRADLLIPKQNASTIKLIRGTITIDLEKEKQTILMASDIKKAQGREIKLHGATARIDQFMERPRQGGYDLTVSMMKNQHGNVGQEWNYYDYFELRDAKGGLYGWQDGGVSTSAVGLEYKYRFRPASNYDGPLGPPEQLVYIKHIPQVYHVPFEFKDLPLP